MARGDVLGPSRHKEAQGCMCMLTLAGSHSHTAAAHRLTEPIGRAIYGRRVLTVHERCLVGRHFPHCKAEHALKLDGDCRRLRLHALRLNMPARLNLNQLLERQQKVTLLWGGARFPFGGGWGALLRGALALLGARLAAFRWRTLGAAFPRARPSSSCLRRGGFARGRCGGLSRRRRLMRLAFCRIRLLGGCRSSCSDAALCRGRGLHVALRAAGSCYAPSCRHWAPVALHGRVRSSRRGTAAL